MEISSRIITVFNTPIYSSVEYSCTFIGFNLCKRNKVYLGKSIFIKTLSFIPQLPNKPLSHAAIDQRNVFVINILAKEISISLKNKSFIGFGFTYVFQVNTVLFVNTKILWLKVYKMRSSLISYFYAIIHVYYDYTL